LSRYVYLIVLVTFLDFTAFVNAILSCRLYYCAAPACGSHVPVVRHLPARVDTCVRHLRSPSACHLYTCRSTLLRYLCGTLYVYAFCSVVPFATTRLVTYRLLICSPLTTFCVSVRYLRLIDLLPYRSLRVATFYHHPFTTRRTHTRLPVRPLPAFAYRFALPVSFAVLPFTTTFTYHTCHVTTGYARSSHPVRCTLLPFTAVLRVTPPLPVATTVGSAGFVDFTLTP